MPFHFPTASLSPSPEEVWTTAFHELGQRIRRHFVRSEPDHRALVSVQGLRSFRRTRKTGGKWLKKWGKPLRTRCNTGTDRARVGLRWAARCVASRRLGNACGAQCGGGE